jgi:hypothetical protein
MYQHLKDGRTTAQALRLAMLHLLRGHQQSCRDSRWRRPRYWAAFLVVGANTCLPGAGSVDTLEGPTEKTPSGTVPREKQTVSSGKKHTFTTKPKKVEIRRGSGEEEEVVVVEEEAEQEDTLGLILEGEQLVSTFPSVFARSFFASRQSARRPLKDAMAAC